MPIRYEAHVVGDCAPYRWSIEVHSPANRHTLSTRGEAETIEQALFDAAEVARDHEAEQRHTNTKRKFTLFEAPGPPAQSTDVFSDLPCEPHADSPVPSEQPESA